MHANHIIHLHTFFLSSIARIVNRCKIYNQLLWGCLSRALWYLLVKSSLLRNNSFVLHWVSPAPPRQYSLVVLDDHLQTQSDIPDRLCFSVISALLDANHSTTTTTTTRFARIFAYKYAWEPQLVRQLLQKLGRVDDSIKIFAFILVFQCVWFVNKVQFNLSNIVSMLIVR